MNKTINCKPGLLLAFTKAPLRPSESFCDHGSNHEEEWKLLILLINTQTPFKKRLRKPDSCGCQLAQVPRQETCWFYFCLSYQKSSQRFSQFSVNSLRFSFICMCKSDNVIVHFTLKTAYLLPPSGYKLNSIYIIQNIIQFCFC